MKPSAPSTKADDFDKDSIKKDVAVKKAAKLLVDESKEV